MKMIRLSTLLTSLALSLVLSLVWLFPSHAQAAEKAQLRCGEGCVFVLKNGKTGELQTDNIKRANTPMAPFSTFKIANSLIALDSGNVTGLEQVFSVDLNRYPQESWWPKSWTKGPVTLTQAYARSALPIYQQIAVNIGDETMASYLALLNYGNRDISSGIDNFWLHGSLKISATEQVNFLEQLYQQKFQLKAKTYEQLKSVMLAKQTPKFRLYAKTGGGYVAKNKALGWYVGYVETGDNVYYFALNIDGKSFDSIKDVRIPLAMQLLRDAKVL